MAKWIITSDDNGDTPCTIGSIEGTQGEAAALLSEKSLEMGCALQVWELAGHTELDIDISVVPDGD